MNGWKAAEMDRERKEREAEEGGGSNKEEGVQLADSGQSTRTPTTEWAQEEKSWAEEREGRLKGEVEEGTVELWSGDIQEVTAGLCLGWKNMGVAYLNVREWGQTFIFKKVTRGEKGSFASVTLWRQGGTKAQYNVQLKGGEVAMQGEAKKKRLMKHERHGQEGGGLYGHFCIMKEEQENREGKKVNC